MAEGLLNYTRLDDPDEVICTTQGRPLSPDDEMRLVDEQDRDVPAGEPGSLLTRGPYTPRGYYRAPEQNARAFTADGWYRSGDICRLTPERQPDRRGPGQGHDQPGRREDLRAKRSRTSSTGSPVSRRSPRSRCPTRSSASGCASTSCHGPGARPTLEEIRGAMEALGVARFKLPEHLVLIDRPARHQGRQDRQEGAARRHRQAPS